MPTSLFDENAEVLQNMAARGNNLDLPRSIDFSHLFPHRAQAEAFARDAGQDGFATKLHEQDRDGDRWDVTASKVMVPTCENITGTEEHLQAMAKAHQGRSDGWGFFDL